MQEEDRKMNINEIHAEEGNPAPPPPQGRFPGVRRGNASLLPIAYLTAVVLGVAVGCILRFSMPKLTEDGQLLINFPVEILQQILYFSCFPFIVSSAIKSCAGLLNAPSEKVFRWASAYVVCTTLLSMVLGLVLVLTIGPGLDAAGQDDAKESFSIFTAMIDLSRNMFPDDLFTAAILHYKTELNEREIEPGHPGFRLDTTAMEVELKQEVVVGANVLGLVVFGFVLGAASLKLETRPQTVFMIQIDALNKSSRKHIQMCLRFAPIAMFFSVASIVVDAQDWGILLKLAKFIGVVLLGHVIYGVFVLPLMYFLCVRRNPYAVIKGIFPAMKTAFVLSSSAAALPLSIQCCEERLRVERSVSRFMLPLQKEINLGGTVLYEVVAVLFVAQLNNVPLQLTDWVTIALTAVVCSFRTAGLPCRGAATTFVVLSMLGFTAKETCLLVVTEYLLDRCNSVINVLGDCIGVALVDRAIKRHQQVGEELEMDSFPLQEEEEEEEEEDDFLHGVLQQGAPAASPGTF